MLQSVWKQEDRIRPNPSSRGAGSEKRQVNTNRPYRAEDDGLHVPRGQLASYLFSDKNAVKFVGSSPL